jgi:malate dehydrogenase (oxaloacetate-decarboxylating)(NADP+)
VKAVAADHGISLGGIEVLDPGTVTWRKEAEDAFLELRKRRGVTRDEAGRKVRERIYFGAMMCRMGKADGLIAGLTMYYPDTIRPCLEVIGTRKGVKRVCGVYTMVLKNRVLFFSDTTMNIEPNSEELAEIALLTADLAKDTFNMEPQVAMLSFSDFGSVDHPLVRKVQKAVEMVKAQRPGLKCDGEMQADTALGDGILTENYPWVDLPGGPNVLIFPDLTSGNIGYKLVQRLAGAEVIGPITCGMAAPVHVLQRHSDMNDIIHLTALTVVEAQQK